MRVCSRHLMVAGLLLALAPRPGVAELPKERSATLALGALFGRPRLEVIAWPNTAELSRLRVIGSPDKRPGIRVLGGYDVLDSHAVTGDELRRLSEILLDPTTYSTMAIRKPRPPSEGGEASIRLCGGFRPALALDLHDIQGRTVRVLLCFGCDEAEIHEVRTGAEKPSTVLHRPQRWPAQGALRIDLTSRGVERLLEAAAVFYPHDRELRFVRREPAQRPPVPSTSP